MIEKDILKQNELNLDLMQSAVGMFKSTSLLLLLLVCHPAHAIRNGTATNKFPAVGFLEPGCTATLLNPNTAITANHCLQQAGRLKNALFHYTQSDGSEQTLVPIKAEVLSESLPMEIALIRFQGQASKVAFPQLPDGPIASTPLKGLAIGYGLNPALRVRTSQQHVGKVAISGYGDVMGPGLPMIQITPFDSRSQLICEGDSGGPLFMGPQIVGIASFAASNDPKWEYLDPFTKCNTAIAGYYVPIYPYLGWIKTALKKLNRSPLKTKPQ